jgi:hypothetical protein
MPKTEAEIQAEFDKVEKLCERPASQEIHDLRDAVKDALGWILGIYEESPSEKLD